MNSLERALVTKAGYDNGWEVVVEETPDLVELASAIHRARVEIFPAPPAEGWVAMFFPEQLHRELRRTKARYELTDEHCWARSEAELGDLLQNAARIARALPDAPEARFAHAVKKELEAQTITTTEIERMVRQRVGQDIYRESLMDYWGGACAVTGIAIPALLRASHAKGWAECASDAERLNVYNGFLLAAHLDALFDRHLVTFSETGEAIFAATIDESVRSQLGLAAPLTLRWLSPEHHPFLAWHRTEFLAANSHPTTHELPTNEKL